MQIHELPAQASIADTDVLALDTGSTTRKITYAAIREAVLGSINDLAINGDLTEKGNINFRVPVTKGTAPNASVARYIDFYDTGTGTAVAADRLGYLGCTYTSGNASQLSLVAYNPNSASTDIVSLGIGYPKDGNPWLTYSGPIANFGSTGATINTEIHARNSEANVCLLASDAGSAGLYSSTANKTGWIIYMPSDSSHALIPRVLRAQNITVSATNTKTASGDGISGAVLTTTGNLHLTSGNGTNPSVIFYREGSTAITGSIYNSATNEITIVASAGLKVASIYTKTTTAAANVNVASGGLLTRYSSSSRRYKHDILPMQMQDYKKVLNIPVVTYKYNRDYIPETDQRYMQDIPGLIAEDVAREYPIAAEWVGAKIEDWNARYIIPPMLAVEQDHEKRITALEAEIKALKGVA